MRTGWRFGTVKGISMLPALLPGDLVRALERDGAALSPGQVIVVEDGDGSFVHRFVRYSDAAGLPSLILTAGDRSGPDSPRPVPARILVADSVLRRGRWRRIPPRIPLPPMPGRFVGRAVRLLKRLLG